MNNSKNSLIQAAKQTKGDGEGLTVAKFNRALINFAKVRAVDMVATNIIEPVVAQAKDLMINHFRENYRSSITFGNPAFDASSRTYAAVYEFRKIWEFFSNLPEYKRARRKTRDSFTVMTAIAGGFVRIQFVGTDSEPSGQGSESKSYLGQAKKRHKADMTMTDDGYPMPTKLVFSYFGASIKRFESWIIDVTDRERRPAKQTISAVQFGRGGGGRNYPTEIQVPPEEMMMVPDYIRREVFDQLDNFVENADYCLENSIPHKAVFMLHGITGCGKTTLARMVASRYGRNLIYTRMTDLNDESRKVLLQNEGRGAVILIDEVDSDVTLWDRKRQTADSVRTVETDQEIEFSEDGKISQTQNGRSIGGYLDVFAGAVPLQDVIVIMTTNTIEVFDDAVIAPHRVDHIVHVRPVHHEEIAHFVASRFPDYTLPAGVRFRDLTAGQVSSLYTANYREPEKFVEALMNHKFEHQTPAELGGNKKGRLAVVNQG